MGVEEVNGWDLLRLASLLRRLFFMVKRLRRLS